MASLVDSIISLEKEADAIVDEAHTQSKNILKASDDEIARYRNELSLELEARLARFKADEDEKCEASLAAALQEHTAKLDALKKLPGDFIRFHAGKIIDRFNNW